MKRIHLKSIIVAAFTLLAMFGNAQDKRTPETKVADILAQLPTKDLIHRDKLMEEIAGLGSVGFQKIAEMLKSPGQGNDTPARFAINSLSRYASGFGKEELKRTVESCLLNSIENQKDKEIQAFLLEELYLVAGINSIEKIKNYITDDKLCEPAIQVLTVVAGKQAAQEILRVLPNSGEKQRLTLIKALGDLKCAEAVPQISGFRITKDKRLKKVILEALANIGSPNSYKLLSEEAAKVKFLYEPTNAVETFLKYINVLGENQELDLCKQGCMEFISLNHSPAQMHYYSKALDIYTSNFGFEAQPLLLKASENKNKEFRYSVYRLANQFKDISTTRQWITKAQNSSPENSSEIIEMLGERGDLTAKWFIKENLNANDELIRITAVSALANLCGRNSVSDLKDHLALGKDLFHTKMTLLQLIDQNHLDAFAFQLDKTSGKTKSVFIDLIASKSGTKYFDKIFPYTQSSYPDERNSAFKALENVSTEKNLAELIKLLVSVGNETEIKLLQKAVVAAVKNSETERNGIGKIAEAINTLDNKDRLIAVLPEIGGIKNLETVARYFNSGTGNSKESAFDALTKWNDYAATKWLFEVCQTNTGEYRSKALRSYVRLVSLSQIPDDQKLLQLRKIMAFAITTGEKKEIVGAVGKLRTFLSLIYLKDYLKNTELQQDAARSVMIIALSDTDGSKGFWGESTKSLLEEVIPLLKGDDSEYDKINIKKLLDKMTADKGFVSMFNGKNLEGWQGLVENPIARAKMTADDLAKKQKIANKKMTENWSVRDNTIVFSGKGDNLCSVKKYGDFEMVVDWRITKNGDSGIYLRGTPQVQVWDTSRVDVGAQVGSGGLYNNQKNASKPLKLADNAIGEWNTFRITMIGENVTVWLNGILVVDNVPLENYWDRKLPVFPVEAIELQAHGTDLAFRDIYVREINTKQIGLTKEEISEGFETLFNGKNLEGWQGNLTDYYADNGELVVQPTRGGKGNIYTQKEYDDFNFRFEFQLTPGANNGLGIRTPLEGDAAYVGMELQILDNTAPIYAKLHEYQYHGSVYGVIPAKREFLKPVGQWNSEEVILKGSKVKVILNGITIVDGDIKEASKNGTLDGKEHPGLLREKGYIGFLGHGSELKFRNIRIKEL